VPLLTFSPVLLVLPFLRRNRPPFRLAKHCYSIFYFYWIFSSATAGLPSNGIRVRAEGPAVHPAKGNALVAKDVHRLFSTIPSLGPTGQSFAYN
jgi:hypothetical protein